jgi:crotonobetainyl-CoA:carnitine CoA-transferase CaiB-like acyl-CoA transferase
MPGPLNGVRVLDLTGVVSGPFATMFLADQGADVLKIEPIGGDITRRSRATIDKAGEFSALFISSNRGKRSLSIDIKSEIGREVLAKLVAQADVLVQNFRPGTMERLGLGPDELRKRQRDTCAHVVQILLVALGVFFQQDVKANLLRGEGKEGVVELHRIVTAEPI